MRNFLLVLIIFSLGSCRVGKALKNNDTDSQRPVVSEFPKAFTGEDTTNLVLTVNVKKEILINEQIQAKLEFKNKLKSEIRLVDLFYDPLINFYVTVFSPQDGNQIAFAGGIKLASFPANYEFKYIEIPRKRSYIFTLNITELLKKNNITIPSGSYAIEITYLNNYGKNCIKGRFNSNTASFSVK